MILYEDMKTVITI